MEKRESSSLAASVSTGEKENEKRDVSGTAQTNMQNTKKSIVREFGRKRNYREHGKRRKRKLRNNSI